MFHLSKVFCQKCAVTARREREQWSGGRGVETEIGDAAKFACGSTIQIVSDELRLIEKGYCRQSPVTRFDIKGEFKVTEELV